jgi:hypothetical protein
MSPLSTQLFPEIVDGSTLNERTTEAVFLPIGIEGQKDAGGTAVVAELKKVSRPVDADTWFGPASSLTALVKFVLDQGAGPVYAIASASGAGPTLPQRQTAWQVLEAKKEVRIRLTDATVDADLAALAVSAKNANLLNNKQVAFVGKPAATSKATLLATNTAVVVDADGAKRTVIVGPAVYDRNGVLKSGIYSAAAVAARVAMNGDPADDLDTAVISNLTGIERDAVGNDIFRQIVVAGVVVNDFEDLLVGGVSPLMPGLDGGVAISHLRMAYKVDSTFDALMTRLIIDQVFVLVRDYCYRFNQLRKGNTESSREQLRSGVDALLGTLRDWIEPAELGDGTLGFDVSVSASADERQQTISYRGEIVRGVQTIVVAPSFTIAA